MQPTHVYNIIKPVLGHRLVLTPEAKLDGKTVYDVLDGLTREVVVPLERHEKHSL